MKSMIEVGDMGWEDGIDGGRESQHSLVAEAQDLVHKAYSSDLEEHHAKCILEERKRSWRTSS